MMRRTARTTLLGVVVACAAVVVASASFVIPKSRTGFISSAPGRLQPSRHAVHSPFPSATPKLPTVSTRYHPSSRAVITRRQAAEGLSALLTQAAHSVPQLSWVFNNLSSLLVLSFVVGIHELGHFLAARFQGIKVKNFSIGFGPALVKYTDQSTDIDYTLRAVPAGGFVSFPRHYEVTEQGEYVIDEDEDLLQNRPPWQQAIVVSSGIIANLLLSYSLLFATVSTAGLPKPQYSDGPMIVRLTDQQAPAAQAGLNPNDIILNINGQKMKGDEKGLVEAVKAISSAGGDKLDLVINRGGKVITKSLTPKVAADGKGSIGILMASHIEKVELVKAKNPGEAIKFVNNEFGSIVKETTGGLKRLTETRSMEGLTGPLGIVQVGADLAAIDSLALVKFAALISVNLAIVNALPLPGLDGGQMISVLLEWARGKRMQLEVQEGINAIAFTVLASMSMFLIFGDLFHGPTNLHNIIESAESTLLEETSKIKP